MGDFNSVIKTALLPTLFHTFLPSAVLYCCQVHTNSTAINECTELTDKAARLSSQKNAFIHLLCFGWQY